MNTLDPAFGATFAGGTAIFTLLVCCIYIFAMVISIALLVIWIWMLVDLVQRRDDQLGETFGKDAKIVWLLLMIFTGGIASVIYYFTVYKKYPRK